MKFNLVKNIWQYLLAFIKKSRLKSTKIEWNIVVITRFDGTVELGDKELFDNPKIFHLRQMFLILMK